MGTLDIRVAEFWEPGNIDAELRRVYDVCAGCRRCLPLCPSFKVLFDRLDVEAVDGDVEELPATDVKEVVDLCYQCKLCYNHCPYTPQDRVLGNTDLVGKIGSLTAPLSNWMNEVGVHRAFMQAALGIHRKRNLPRFQRPTFSAWFRGRPAPAEPAVRPRKVALFATGQVEYHDAAVGRATVRVLEKNGVEVTLPTQRCCGMPYLDGGAVEEARALMRDNVRSLAEAARQGCDIVAPGPTCSYMLKQEYPWLDGSDDARLVAGQTLDLFEYLARLRAEGALSADFRRPVGKVAYHVPCHLRAQNIGTKSADVLRAIPGAEVDVIERCSAVDGTWGFKKEYYELSLSVAKPLFEAIRATGAPTVATDCPLAALQLTQGTGATPRHPIQILADAYGLRDDEP